MKNTTRTMLHFGAISFLTLSCQSVPSEQKTSYRKPIPAKPLPSWTKRQVQSRGDQQVRISTKLIEIFRPNESSEIPTKPYERVLNQNEYQLFMRQITQQKGTDIMTAPHLLARDGEKATTQIIKEFAYPLTPNSKTKFATENIGVISHYDVDYLGDRKISLKMFTRVSELEGYYVTQPEFQLPVFNRRDVHSAFQLKAGETMLLGGYIDTITQKVENKGLLGIFKKSSQEKSSRELIITVTAELLKPDGTKL
ncbi:MAG: hypothetical protein ACSHX0_00955 [Akkermansiaceae bacterium]